MNKNSNLSASSTLTAHPSPLSFVFFGSSDISVTVLNELEKSGFLPKLVVTKTDKPKGRGLTIQKSPVKIWAEKKGIEVLSPISLKDHLFISPLTSSHSPLGILVSYGKIIPKDIIDIFPMGILNLHPSLLPLLRGPSPIENTILKDMRKEAGVSVMLLDEKMDEGPVLSQEKVHIPDWPPTKTYLYNLLGKIGGELLADILPKWLSGEIEATPQDHAEATYTKIIKKTDGLIDKDVLSYENYLKYLAYEGWPGTFFFLKDGEKEVRIKIAKASFENGQFKIEKVIPEGKKEMEYSSYLRGLK